MRWLEIVMIDMGESQVRAGAWASIVVTCMLGGCLADASHDVNRSSPSAGKADGLESDTDLFAMDTDIDVDTELDTDVDEQTPELGPSAGCGLVEDLSWLSPHTLPWGAPTWSGELEVDGIPRTFLLRLPNVYEPDFAYPIVFSLHGSDSSVESAWGYNHPHLWPQGRVITVMPAGLDQNWDFDPIGVDVAFFDALNAELGARLCIDESRRFVQGVSGGAALTHTLACVRAHEIHAVAATAGAQEFDADVHTCEGSVSAFLVHGTQDTVVPFADGIVARDDILARNNCEPLSNEHPTLPCEVFQSCGDEVVFWCPHDGAHVDHVSLGLREAVLAFFVAFL